MQKDGKGLRSNFIKTFFRGSRENKNRRSGCVSSPSTPHFIAPKVAYFASVERLSWSRATQTTSSASRQGDWLLVAGAKLWNRVFFLIRTASLIFIQIVVGNWRMSFVLFSICCFLFLFFFFKISIWGQSVPCVAGTNSIRSDKSLLTNDMKELWGKDTREGKGGGYENGKRKNRGAMEVSVLERVPRPVDV